MRVLVIGAGGREHALCFSLAASSSVQEVVCAPGSAGIAQVARLRQVDPLDPAAVAGLSVEEGVDLVVVGPEGPLSAGVADAVMERGVPVFGPTAEAARLESSKAFAKELMTAAGVPTAGFWSGSEVDGALGALNRFGPPFVVKADGLAAGKGVVVTPDRGEAEAAVRAALEEHAFGEAGATLVVEEFLDGPELSAFAVCDGQSVRLLELARDHKRLEDGDHGPNTGGMGAFSPVPGLGEELAGELAARVFVPVVGELRRRGIHYVGVLYAGLVLTSEGPKVLEFNARFGDPETQVVIPRLRSDLGSLLAACAHGELGGVDELEWDPRTCVTVVLASGGYPGEYRTGLPISGLEHVADTPNVAIFHAGTERDEHGFRTVGGRVLAVTAFGEDVASARAAAYAAADQITFDGLHRRNDIALSR